MLEREIVVLPEVVQNKIAAGEVVERPASAVKELAENALDAGATRIHVELEQGGHRLIRITDNGCGMGETNLARSVERHATSKIRDIDDIFRIRTMGFRGEALPSIGSVSRMKIQSAPAGAETGFTLLVQGGVTERLSPCPPRGGTVVEVRDLFFNTPARKKFMKQPSAEVAAVSEIVTRLALANPSVSFGIQNDGKKTLELPVHGSLAERMAALFGGDLAGKLIPVDHETEGLRVEGLVARPPESRPTSRGLYVFLNRRWIRHAGIARVVADAFQGALPPRRYPFGCLYVDLDPSKVDVNVHPTKEEVRFEDDRLVLGSIRRAVDNALLAMRRQEYPREMRVMEATAPYLNATPGARTPPEAASNLHAPRSSAPFLTGTNAPFTATPAQPHPSSPIATTPETSATSGNGKDERSSLTSAGGEKNGVSPLPAQAELSIDREAYRVIGQAGNRYLIVESPRGVRIVDQHALHERWNYERLLDREHPILCQRLLTPVVVELSPAESALFDAALPVLRELGFDVEPFGECALAVSAHPEIVKPAGIARLIRDVFADLEQGKHALDQLRHKLLASLACRSAVLFGQSLTPDAVVEILRKHDNTRQPYTCPHGRPTSIFLSWDDLARRFERA